MSLFYDLFWLKMSSTFIRVFNLKKKKNYRKNIFYKRVLLQTVCQLSMLFQLINLIHQTKLRSPCRQFYHPIPLLHRRAARIHNKSQPKLPSYKPKNLVKYPKQNHILSRSMVSNGNYFNWKQSTVVAFGKGILLSFGKQSKLINNIKYQMQINDVHANMK